MRAVVMRALKIALPLALLAYFIAAFVDTRSFLALAGTTDARMVCAYVGCLLLSRWLQAHQTRVAMVEAGVAIGTWEIFRVQLVSNFYTMFVPGDIVGGGVTWYLLQKTRGAGAIIGVVLLYVRLVFLVTAIPLALIGLSLEGRIFPASAVAVFALVSVAAIAVTMPLVHPGGAEIVRRFLITIGSWLEPRAAGFRRVLSLLGEGIVKCASASARTTASVFGLSLALHVLGALGLWFGAEASSANVPLHAFLWIWPLMLVVHMLPISLGGLGVREITLIYVLNALYATSAESILLLSLIALAASTAFSLAGGAWMALRVARSQDRAA